MIEIAISLAVIGVALVAIIGVLPLGMRVQKDNRQETIINQDAVYLMDALRSGARGLDDLTNYVRAISVRRTITNLTTHIVYSVTNSYLNPGYPAGFSLPNVIDSRLTNGQDIIGILSLPRIQDPGGDSITNNQVLAYMQAISGNASEKWPQTNSSIRDLAFAYRLNTELAAAVTPGYDTTNRLVANNLSTNLYELRLTFRWPLLPNGGVGPGKLTFRTLAAGNLSSTYVGHDLYFLQPGVFVATTNDTDHPSF